MTYSVRLMTADDFASVMALYHTAKPLGMSPPEEVWEGAIRCVAVDAKTEEIIGYGAAEEKNPSFLALIVHPKWQRQGVGHALGAWLRPALEARGVTAVEPWVREENAAGIAWLEKHDFRPTKLDGPVRLILPNADLTPFEPIADAVAAQGITVTALAEEMKRDPACLPKLQQLDNEINGRAPASAQELEAFIKTWSTADKEQERTSYFIARDGDRYVGLSNGGPRAADAFFEEKHDIFQQGFTGVLPEYRQRGIATALKLRVIAYAKSYGYNSLWTNSDNPAMCALNKKLGFQSGPWRVYRKEIANGTDG